MMRLFVMCVALLLLATTACSTTNLPFQSSAQPVELRYIALPVYDPVYVALDKGMFDQHGVHVTIAGNVQGGVSAIQAVAGGAAEASGPTAIPALINARAAGLDVVGVADVQSTLPDQPLEDYFVLASSPLHTVDDLAHQATKPKIAVNTLNASFHYTMLLALQQHNISEDAVEFVTLPFDQQPDALRNHAVDVISLITPHNQRLRATMGNDARLLTDGQQVFGSKQFSLAFINGAWARAHPDQTRAFVAGLVDAQAWIEAHPDEAAAIVGKAINVDAQYIGAYHFQPHGAVDQPSVQFWIDFLHNRGDLTADVKLSDVATNAYNEAVH